MTERTAVAHCDHEGCGTTAIIDSGNWQRAIVRMGWKLDRDGITTFCPEHVDDVAPAEQ